MTGAASGQAAVSRWQLLTALGALTAAGLHLPVLVDHLTEAAYMGGLFAAFALVNCAFAAALVTRPTPTAFLGVALLNAAAVGTYVATRLVAFPQLADDVGAWVEPWGVLAITAELLTATVGWLGWRAAAQPIAN